MHVLWLDAATAAEHVLWLDAATAAEQYRDDAGVGRDSAVHQQQYKAAVQGMHQ
jgi:hypothetical protein